MIHGSVQSSCAEVVCLFCGHHTTALVVMSGISLVRCRLCGKEARVRYLFAPAEGPHSVYTGLTVRRPALLLIGARDSRERVSNNAAFR